MQDPPGSPSLAADEHTRGTDCDRSYVNQNIPATEMIFPALESGITLLDVEDTPSVPLLQSLVLDHLLMHDGLAFWVDADGHATTTTFARITPSQRLLDRIQVARGFTAYQHYAAICTLQTAISGEQQQTESSGEQYTPRHTGDRLARSPSLIAAPAIDAQYRADDTLDPAHAATLQARALAQLSSYVDEHDVPVVVTRSASDEFTAPVAQIADHQLVCEQTQMGPRIVGNDFETLVYPVGDGAYRQTTFAYWHQLLTARAAQVGIESQSDGSQQRPANGITADTMTGTADPLLDAWTADTGRR